MDHALPHRVARVGWAGGAVPREQGQHPAGRYGVGRDVQLVGFVCAGDDVSEDGLGGVSGGGEREGREGR